MAGIADSDEKFAAPAARATKSMNINSLDESPIDNYIRTFSGKAKEKLEEMRKILREEAPEAQEKISYGMPTYYLFGNLVHFAGYANHLGFYPTPSGIKNFMDEIQNYKTSKGTIQFSLDEPLPEQLIRRIMRFRREENYKMEVDRKRKAGKKKK